MKSPVASLCFVCSSVRKRVRVTMSYLTFSSITGDNGFDMARRRSEDFICSDRGMGEGGSLMEPLYGRSSPLTTSADLDP